MEIEEFQKELNNSNINNNNNASDSEDDELHNLELEERIDAIINRVKVLDIKKEVGEKEAALTTRLIIEKIELFNFKSYQGTKVIGPLYHQFNSVVGPNGSGKSNLMESLLFVFGKKAKKMRLKKLSDLIHKSTDHTNLNYARVSVYFKEIKDIYDKNNNINYEEVANSSFVLSREVNKNSVSKYYLNNIELSFKDVCNKLEKFNIDLKHNRFLILQGEVEQISMLSQKSKNNSKEGGLLEFLEDIIGTSRYLNIINYLDKDIEQITEVKNQKEKRIRVCKTDLNKLEEVKNKAIKYFYEEKDAIYLNYLILKLNEFKENVENNKKLAIINNLEEEKNKKTQELSKLKKENEDVIIKLSELKKNEKKSEKQKKALEDKLIEFENKDNEIKIELENLEKNIQKQENLKISTIKKLDDFNEKYTAIKEETPNLKTLYEKQLNNLNKIEVEVTKKEKEIYDKSYNLQQKKKDLEDKIKPFKDEIKQSEFEIIQNNSTLEVIDKEYNDINNNLQLKKQEYDRVNISNEKMTLELNNLENELSNIKNTNMNIFQKSLNEINELINLKDKIINENLSKKSDLINEAKKQQQKSKLITALLEQKRNGNIPGIIGRLGDLAAINEKYDIAISTCCPQLDSILVDNVETGEKCINFLKKHNIGRTNFVLLDQMSKYNNDVFEQPIEYNNLKLKNNFNTPKNTERIFDKINFSKLEYATAFYHFLKNTLVAFNLEIANNVAFQSKELRYRVVTLNGELIETSGAMSGGGRPRQGLMSNKNSCYNQDHIPDIIRNCENIIEATSIELSKLKEQRLKTESDYNDIGLKANAYKSKIYNINSAITNNQKLQANLETDISYLNSELNKLSNQRNKSIELYNKNELLTSKINNLTNEFKDLLAELEKLQEELDNIGGNKYKNNKNELNKLSAEVKKLSDIILSNTSFLSQAEDELLKIKENINERKKCIEEFKLSIKQKKEEFELVYNEGLKVYNSIESQNALIKEIKEEFEKTTELNKEFKEKLRIISNKKESIDKDINDVKVQIKRIVDKIENINKEQQSVYNYYLKLTNEFGFIEEIYKEIEELNIDICEKQHFNNNINNEINKNADENEIESFDKDGDSKIKDNNCNSSNLDLSNNKSPSNKSISKQSLKFNKYSDISIKKKTSKIFTYINSDIFNKEFDLEDEEYIISKEVFNIYIMLNFIIYFSFRAR